MDLALILDRLAPGAAYGGSLSAGTEAAYDAIRWEDERAKPTWLQVLAEAAVMPSIGQVEKAEARSRVIRRVGARGDDTAVAIRGVMVVVNAGLNELRRAAGLPEKTTAQAMAAWNAVIRSGAAD